MVAVCLDGGVEAVREYVQQHVSGGRGGVWAGGQGTSDLQCCSRKQAPSRPGPAEQDSEMQFAVAADTRGAVAGLMRAAGVREVPHAFLLDTQVGGVLGRCY